MEARDKKTMHLGTGRTDQFFSMGEARYIQNEQTI
jgi:hypothetical protein